MNVDLSGLDRLKSKLSKIVNIDASPLMASVSQIMADDNRRGIMRGEDKDGSYMLAVRYRPTTATPKKPSKTQRNGVRANAKFGVFGGKGPMNAGLHNNLTPSEYRKLAGPPLAPRGVFSRVITNFTTAISQVSNTVWTVTGGWFEVVSPKGKPFLKYLFAERDLRGVRPEGIRQIRRAAIAWMRDVVRFG